MHVAVTGRCLGQERAKRVTMHRFLLLGRRVWHRLAIIRKITEDLFDSSAFDSSFQCVCENEVLFD